MRQPGELRDALVIGQRGCGGEAGRFSGCLIMTRTVVSRSGEGAMAIS